MHGSINYFDQSGHCCTETTYFLSEALGRRVELSCCNAISIGYRESANASREKHF